MKLLPFFTYYGGKFRVAPKYPAPMHNYIVEPFAGSAGYSLNYPNRQVFLIDLDENITQTWDYLIRASEDEVLALPDIAEGQTVGDLDVAPEARLLIGWWLNKGSSQPKRKPSTFMLRYPEGGPYWGPRVRERIASQQWAIRHWRVTQGHYNDAPNLEATWFIDPPYAAAGRRYRHGAKGIDFDDLSAYCQMRRGQVIVCEADDADWLPFTDLAVIDGTEGRQKVKRARREVAWFGQTCPDCRMAHDRRPCLREAALCSCCEALEVVAF